MPRGVYIRGDYHKGVPKGNQRKLVYGIGTYDADESMNYGGNRSQAYKTWANMLRSVKYRDRSICKEWHSFINFRRWWLEHQGDHLVDIDETGEVKAYLNVFNNKEAYSPTNCYVSDSKQWRNANGSSYSSAI